MRPCERPPGFGRYRRMPSAVNRPGVVRSRRCSGPPCVKTA